MLTILQNPNNKYLRMEQNPGHSKDLMHGVPEIFNSILNQRISIAEKTSNLSDNMKPVSPDPTYKPSKRAIAPRLTDPEAIRKKSMLASNNQRSKRNFLSFS